MQLSENTLKTIAKSIKNYFEKQGMPMADIRPPYLGEVGKFPAMAFSGLIQIFGEYHGAIYFTASRGMLERIADKMGFDQSTETYLDMIGEMTNIFAGNIREDLGSEFNISTPLNFEGSVHNETMSFKGIEKPYILPITFWAEKALLVIYFERVA